MGNFWRNKFFHFFTCGRRRSAGNFFFFFFEISSYFNSIATWGRRKLGTPMSAVRNFTFGHWQISTCILICLVRSKQKGTCYVLWFIWLWALYPFELLVSISMNLLLQDPSLRSMEVGTSQSNGSRLRELDSTVYEANLLCDDDFNASCNSLSVYFLPSYVFRFLLEKQLSLNFFNPEFF